MKTTLFAGAVALATTALTATAALAGAPGPALAEPAVPAPAAPVVPVAANWAGGYAGLGLSFGTTSYRQADSAFWPSGNGFGISGLAGFNWQAGNTVFGVEGHLGASQMRGRTTTGVPVQVTTDLRALGSLRGRVGIAQGESLFFVTGGLAGAQVNHTAAGLGSESRTLNGWVVGAGFETALGGGLNLRGDLEHYRFNRADFNTAGIAFPGLRTQANVARLSAVFRF